MEDIRGEWITFQVSKFHRSINFCVISITMANTRDKEGHVWLRQQNRSLWWSGKGFIKEKITVLFQGCLIWGEVMILWLGMGQNIVVIICGN